MSSKPQPHVCLLLTLALLPSLSFAVTPDRISANIDSSSMVEVKGHVAAMARPEFDQGPVESSRFMQVTMLFTPTLQQDQALQKLLADQQDPKSPTYHKWLTISQYADQFGLSPSDVEKIKDWLGAQGLKVTYVAKGRDFLSFEGNAGQVQSVFHTDVHYYNVNGKMHFANATAPVIPAALSGIVGGFRGMHDFHPHPMLKQHAAYSVPTDGGFFTYIAPNDLAIIYNINPLYQLSPAIDGTGQSVVVAGQSDVYLADINDFRNGFGFTALSGCTLDGTSTIIKNGACAAGKFQMVVPGTGSDPGISSGDLGESDLDIEWITSVARGAQTIFVTSSNGVDDSASWAIDNQLAPVISYSYGLCEALVNAPNIAASELEYKKAAGLGISFFAASGDAASATCDGDNGAVEFPTTATLGLSVSYPASSAYITGVGGTEFDEGGGNYWSQNNTNNASVLSYIPESAWNDTFLAGSLDGSGGGPSNCAFGSHTVPQSGWQGTFSFEICTAPPNGGFPKPSWQVATGVPTDGVRDVPDISFSASNGNDPYIVCAPQSEVVTGSSATTSTCSGGISNALSTYNSAFGGTSASTPVAAGMAVLLNQYLGANGLGLLNPQLYKLYGTNPSAFHPIESGTNSWTGGSSDNIVPCTSGQPNFGEPSTIVCPAGGTFGYTAGPTYNLVTGLGSINFNALFQVWGGAGARTATTTAISASTHQINVGQNVTFTATVTGSTSTSGTVSFFNNGSTTAFGSATVQNGVASFATTSLPGGTDNVTASYLGDASHASSTSSATVVAVTAPDFTLGAAPTSGSVVAGHTTTGVTVTVTPVNGFNQVVSFSCTGAPTGAACNFNPQTVTPDGTHAVTTTLTLLTNASMAGGTTTVTVNASGSGVSHTSPYALTVTTPTDQSYSLAPVTPTYSASQGQSVTATVTLTGSNGFNTTNSPVNYTCGDTVSESQCTVNVTSNGATFLLTTTAPTGARAFTRSSGTFYGALLPGLLGITFVAGSRKRSLPGMRLLGLILAIGFSTMWLASCGGSNSGSNSNPGTPKGSYTITVNATTNGANPVTASTTFMLQVN